MNIWQCVSIKGFLCCFFILLWMRNFINTEGFWLAILIFFFKISILKTCFLTYYNGLTYDLKVPENIVCFDACWNSLSNRIESNGKNWIKYNYVNPSNQLSAAQITGKRYKYLHNYCVCLTNSNSFMSYKFKEKKVIIMYFKIVFNLSLGMPFSFFKKCI